MSDDEFEGIEHDHEECLAVGRSMDDAIFEALGSHMTPHMKEALGSATPTRYVLIGEYLAQDGERYLSISSARGMETWDVRGFLYEADR